MPQQPQQSPSFIQQFQFAKGLMRFPALSILVFLRRDLGIRMLNPLVLLATFGLLFVVAVLATPGNEAARPMDLAVFAVVGFLNGLAQLIRHWWNLNRAPHRHSYYIGSSPFDQKWLWVYLRQNRRAARFLDPLVCAGIGFILLPYSRALAMWLIFSALCLRAYEYNIHVVDLEIELDLKDSLIESGRHSEILEQGEPSPDAMPNQPDAGVPTGLGDDIRNQIRNRKSSKT